MAQKPSGAGAQSLWVCYCHLVDWHARPFWYGVCAVGVRMTAVVLQFAPSIGSDSMAQPAVEGLQDTEVAEIMQRNAACMSDSHV
jgi:hypothetical protein